MFVKTRSRQEWLGLGLDGWETRPEWLGARPEEFDNSFDQYGWRTRSEWLGLGRNGLYGWEMGPEQLENSQSVKKWSFK